MLGGIAFLHVPHREARAEHFDPTLSDDYVPANHLISNLKFQPVFIIRMSPSKFLGIPENFSAHGGQVDHMLDVVHWFMIALFVGWTIFFLYCIVRFWHRRNPKASYTGVKSHLSSHLEVGVIIVEVVLLLGFAFPLWAERVDSWKDVQKLSIRCACAWSAGSSAGPITTRGGRQVRPRRSRLMSGVGDIGLDLDDPNALDDFTSPILNCR
jgi:cytochrome c oxidase subunit II